MPIVNNKKAPAKPIGVTFYFTRKDFTEPELDDIFNLKIPQYIIKKYEESNKDIWILLSYIQENGDSELNEKLNCEDWVNQLEYVNLHICDKDEQILPELKTKLLSNMKEIQYCDLDEILDLFFRDHSMDNLNHSEKIKYLQTYLDLRI